MALAGQPEAGTVWPDLNCAALAMEGEVALLEIERSEAQEGVLQELGLGLIKSGFIVLSRTGASPPANW